MTLVRLFAGSFLLASTIFIIMQYLRRSTHRNSSGRKVLERSKSADSKEVRPINKVQPTNETQPIKKEGHPANLSLDDYNTYVMTYPERALNTAVAAGVIFAVAYVFYHHPIISALPTPLALCYPKIKSAKIAGIRKRELNLQFKEALYSLASSISAGKSVEKAFKDVIKDLAVIYPNPETLIIREFTAIAGKIEMNETIESALADLARRSHDEDIKNFADVFITGKRSGGNMAEIIRNTAAVINDKLRIKEEINTLLTERKLEQQVLNIMPVALILLLTWSTGDYMTPVFETALGRLIMTIALVLLALSYFIARKITDIEV
jgi:tight adherence protein B